MNKENQICDAGLQNGRRFRVGWGPKLCLLHTGDNKESGAGVQSKIRENQFLFGGRIPYGSKCPDLNVTIKNLKIGDGSDNESYLLVSLNFIHFQFKNRYFSYQS